ncbi:copper resistance CopC family protein [Actinosynnema sp. NPDC020468]|uniref:copper resistance CopC family protein n=1 Tax=Actinosynnema sp. NPDC020468 TaxID=3154488 RepID=UPI00340F7FC0
MIRLVCSALLAALAVLVIAPVASAHTELTASDPASGATLTAVPARLTLTFTEPIPADSAVVTITGPDGVAWRTGTPTATDATLTVPVTGVAGSGEQKVTWKVQALDGDFVDGTFAFTLDAPAASTTSATTTVAPTPTTTTTAIAGSVGNTPSDVRYEDDGVPAWVWIVAAAVVLGVGLAIGLRRGSRRG